MENIRQLIFGSHDPYKDFKPIGYDLQGWNSNVPAFEKCLNEVNPKFIIEVGSWKGASAIHMARLLKRTTTDFHILCIDTWLGSVEHWSKEDPNLPSSKLRNGRPVIYDQFLSNVVITELTNHITALPMDSINAGLFLERIGVQADLIYIDAGHEYDSVKADLLLYSKLVRPGGYLLGDDWFHPPIKQAVADTLGEVVTLSADKFLWKKPETLA